MSSRGCAGELGDVELKKLTTLSASVADKNRETFSKWLGGLDVDPCVSKLKVICTRRYKPHTVNAVVRKSGDLVIQCGSLSYATFKALMERGSFSSFQVEFYDE